MSRFARFEALARRPVARLYLAATFVACASLIFASTSRAEILTVDCDEGPFFEIADAVAVAVDGDTVLVRACSGVYSSFLIEDRNELHVVAEPGPERPRVSDDEAIACVEIRGGSKVSVQGLAVGGCVLDGISISGSEHSAIGNRAERQIEGIRDLGFGSKIVGNFARDCFSPYTLLGSGGFFARNTATENRLAAVSVVGDDYTIVENDLFGNESDGIDIGRRNNRVERNRSVGNLLKQGNAEIFIRFNAEETVVVGNVTGDSILDQGEDTELAGNR